MNSKSTPPPDPAAFFEAVHLSFQHAVKSTGSIDRYIQIAGHTIRLHFAGPSLIPTITPALEHLASNGEHSTADLTICLWDSSTTDAPLLNEMGDTTWMLHSRRGELLDYSDDNYQTALQVDAGILNILDKKHNLALSWVQHPTQSIFKLAAPCQLILHWWLRERGLLMIHSAAVGLEKGAALLVGQSGAGKSTASLACLHTGMKYLADDRCLMTLDPKPRVYALYNSGKIIPSQIHHFPRFQHAITNPTALSTDKALLFVKQTAPEQIALHLPIKVILLARLTYQKKTTISPIKPLVVCQILASSTMIYAPGWSQADLRGAAQLVQQVPCYAINMGTDIWQIPKLISQTITNELTKEHNITHRKLVSSSHQVSDTR